MKIAEVDFITEKHWWDWEWWNYLVLAGFLNNLASLQGDQTEMELRVVGEHIGYRESDIDETVQQFLKELELKCHQEWNLAGAPIMLLIPSQILARSMQEPSKTMQEPSKTRDTE